MIRFVCYNLRSGLILEGKKQGYSYHPVIEEVKSDNAAITV